MRAGCPIVQHHIEACVQVPDLREILILGFYPANEMAGFVGEMNRKYSGVNIRYLQEYAPLGTAGGIYHFRDQIRAGNPDAFFVMNGDVCCDFPLESMVSSHTASGASLTLMTTEATRQQSLNYGCVVEDKSTHWMRHYVEKPSTYISSLVSTGVYLVTQDIFNNLKEAFEKKQADYAAADSANSHTSNGNGFGESEVLWFERDVLPQMAGSDTVHVYQTSNWWTPVKTAASAVYANRHYLQLYKNKNPERLSQSKSSNIVGNVYIHSSAKVHPSAVIGPNVSIGAHVEVGEGARIKESI